MWHCDCNCICSEPSQVYIPIICHHFSGLIYIYIYNVQCEIHQSIWFFMKEYWQYVRNIFSNFKNCFPRNKFHLLFKKATISFPSPPSYFSSKKGRKVSYQKSLDKANVRNYQYLSLSYLKAGPYLSQFFHQRKEATDTLIVNSESRSRVSYKWNFEDTKFAFRSITSPFSHFPPSPLFPFLYFSSPTWVI